jgi:hypothetical protein
VVAARSGEPCSEQVCAGATAGIAHLLKTLRLKAAECCTVRLLYGAIGLTAGHGGQVTMLTSSGLQIGSSSGINPSVVHGLTCWNVGLQGLVVSLLKQDSTGLLTPGVTCNVMGSSGPRIVLHGGTKHTWYLHNPVHLQLQSTRSAWHPPGAASITIGGRSSVVQPTMLALTICSST